VARRRARSAWKNGADSLLGLRAFRSKIRTNTDEVLNFPQTAPGQKSDFPSMPRGSNKKREREYDELKREFKQEHRYKGREEEVAARIVNKQRARFGETKAEKRKDRQGKSPDRDLPIKDYQHKTVAQVERAMGSLSASEVKKVEAYEKKHKNRKTLLEVLHGQGKNGASTKKKSSSANGSSKSAESRKNSSSWKTKSSSSKTKKTRSGSSDSGDDNITTDHAEIRRWVEARGGHPATVRSTVGKGHEPGILRIDFPDYSGADALEEISWEEFFEKFEKEKLAFLHQNKTSGGKQSRFNKLIAR
jgi:hypothetical protein